MADRKIVERGELFEEDSTCANKWKWEWMDVSVDEERIGNHIRKIARSGVTICTICGSKEYGTRGRVALTDHIKSNSHATAVKSIQGNFAITGMSSNLILVGVRYQENKIIKQRGLQTLLWHKGSRPVE